MRRSDEQAWAALVHFLNAIPVWGLFFCGSLWFINREKSHYIVAQALKAMYFHSLFLCGLLIWIVITLVTIVLSHLFTPLAALLTVINPIIIVILMALHISICLWGTMRCWSGRSFSYPLVSERKD